MARRALNLQNVQVPGRLFQRGLPVVQVGVKQREKAVAIRERFLGAGPHTARVSSCVVPNLIADTHATIVDDGAKGGNSRLFVSS